MGEGRRDRLGVQVSQPTVFLLSVNYSRECLPYFKKAQTHELATGPDDPFRGHNGPLYVSQGKCENPLHKAFIEAGRQLGIGFTPDMNGFRQQGFGPMDMTIKDGKRQSSSTAYLKHVSLIFPYPC